MAKLDPIGAGRESLADLVFEAVREAIIGHRFAPGDRVTEAAIAEELQVSKTPVREAFFRLQFAGLLESDGRRGGRIARATPEAIRNAYEARIALEVEAARLVCERGGPEDIRHIAQLAQASHEAAIASDLQRFRAEDRAFHLAIAKATDNSRLQDLIRDAFDLTWTLRRRDVPAADDSVACAAQHVKIAQALEARKPEVAASHMRAHVDKVRSLVLEAYAQAS